jgi:hypothetical protein
LVAKINNLFLAPPKKKKNTGKYSIKKFFQYQIANTKISVCMKNTHFCPR